MWATDYPRGDHGVNCVEELRELGARLSAETRRRFHGATAEALYGFA